MFRLILLLPVSPSVALAQTGGPDSGGYFYGPAPFDFVDLASTGTALTPDENVAITLPWAFPWYGADYIEATVGLHGGLRFGAGDIDDSPACLPDAGDAPDIAAYWADIALDGGEVYSFHDPVVDRFIVSWEGVEVGFGGAGDFQLQLFPDGRVELHWSDLDWSGTATTTTRRSTPGRPSSATASTGTATARRRTSTTTWTATAPPPATATATTPSATSTPTSPRPARPPASTAWTTTATGTWTPRTRTAPTSRCPPA